MEKLKELLAALLLGNQISKFCIGMHMVENLIHTM
jgi:hypothetical protein